MNIIPSEVRADILEFVPDIHRQYGRMNPLGVGDSEIVRRIKQYDPTFDYREWRRLLELRKTLAARERSPGAKLYRYRQKVHKESRNNNFLRMNFYPPDDEIVNSEDIPEIEVITKLLRLPAGKVLGRYELEYDLTGDEEEVKNIYVLDSPNIHLDYLIEDLRQHPTVSYNLRRSHGIRSPGNRNAPFPELYDISRALIIPRTLESYLESVIVKSKREPLDDNPFLPLMDALGCTDWFMSFDHMNGVCTISSDDNALSGAEIYSYFPDRFKAHLDTLTIEENSVTFSTHLDRDNPNIYWYDVFLEKVGDILRDRYPYKYNRC